MTEDIAQEIEKEKISNERMTPKLAHKPLLQSPYSARRSLDHIDRLLLTHTMPTCEERSPACKARDPGTPGASQWFRPERIRVSNCGWAFSGRVVGTVDGQNCSFQFGSI